MKTKDRNNLIKINCTIDIENILWAEDNMIKFDGILSVDKKVFDIINKKIVNK